MSARPRIYGETTAVHVGKDARWNLKSKDGHLEDGSDQDELESVETDGLDLVDEAGGDDGGTCQALNGRHAYGEWVRRESSHGRDVQVRRYVAFERPSKDSTPQRQPRMRWSRS